MPVRTFSLEDDLWAIAPEGRLNLPASREMETALSQLLAQGRCRIVADFSAVTYLNSNSLKVLRSALRRARKAGGDVRLAALNPRVREIFEMAGLDQVFTVYEKAGEIVEKV